MQLDEWHVVPFALFLSLVVCSSYSGSFVSNTGCSGQNKFDAQAASASCAPAMSGRPNSVSELKRPALVLPEAPMDACRGAAVPHYGSGSALAHVFETSSATGPAGSLTGLSQT